MIQSKGLWAQINEKHKTNYTQPSWTEESIKAYFRINEVKLLRERDLITEDEKIKLINLIKSDDPESIELVMKILKLKRNEIH